MKNYSKLLIKAIFLVRPLDPKFVILTSFYRDSLKGSSHCKIILVQTNILKTEQLHGISFLSHHRVPLVKIISKNNTCRRSLIASFPRKQNKFGMLFFCFFVSFFLRKILPKKLKKTSPPTKKIPKPLKVITPAKHLMLL